MQLVYSIFKVEVFKFKCDNFEVVLVYKCANEVLVVKCIGSGNTINFKGL